MKSQEFGFEDPIPSSSPTLKWKEGERKILSLARFKRDESGKIIWSSPQFQSIDRVYIEGVGYVEALGPEYEKVAGQKPKNQFGTVVISWPLLQDGTLDKAAIASGDFTPSVWSFGRDKFETLKELQSGMPLHTVDVAVKCTDSKYQKMTITACSTIPDGGSSMYRWLTEKKPQLMESKLESINSLGNNLRSILAQNLTISQIQERLSGQRGGPGGLRGTGPTAATPAARMASVASASDISSILDDIA